MPYNILLLPLCGGYFILLNFVYLKYKYQRLTSQRILFSSIITAIFLLFVTFIIRYIANSINPDTEVHLFNWLNNNLKVHHVPYLWTSIASFLIAFFGTIIINLSVYLYYDCSFKPTIAYAVGKYGDEIEKLFKVSAKTGQMMQITMKNNKVYIGFTDIIPVPKETNYLTITPVLSGYRESETKSLIITTDYFKVLEIYMTDSSEFDIYDIDVSIKQDEIISARIYDQNVYDLFNSDDESQYI